MKVLAGFLLCLFSFVLNGQKYWDSRRELELTNVSKGQEYSLDSLSVQYSTFEVFNHTSKLDSTDFTLYPLFSKVIFHQDYDSLYLNYRVFQFKVKESYYTLDSSAIGIDPKLELNPFRIIGEQRKVDNPWEAGGLNKSGVLSRGISFGNNQDMTVNSNMNIQLNGSLANDIQVRASINDESIPFQPEGNTQKLQEFDNVFIELSKDDHRLTAGDFVLNELNSELLRFNKKAQGLSYQKQNDSIRTHLSAAVSRGKFSRNVIQGEEGNQGPYKLLGANNEQFIIVLSGTERIFIDGVLLKRGISQDYTIDYNTAEVTFMARNLITKDKRIIVEFQYSDQRYSRSLVYFNQKWKSKNWEFDLGIYSEQDSKNQPLQQSLSDGDKLVLANAGDNLFAAVTPNVDSVPFVNTEVLYAKRDSLVEGINQEYYQYSTHPDSANYRLNFSFVGAFNGNYNLANAGVNGRVYNWVAPINGVPQGSYEPVVILFPPEKKQVVDLKTSYRVNKKLSIYNESALSNNDRNTFSIKDANDDVGLSSITGLKIENELNKEKSLNLEHDFRYQFIQNSFESIQRIRSVEFNRDWNVSTDSLINDDHMFNYTLNLKQGSNKASINSSYYLHEDLLNAGKVGSEIFWQTKNKWRIQQKASVTRNELSESSFSFARQKVNIQKSFGAFQVKLFDEFENNQTVFNLSDSLSPVSYAFHHWRGSIINADTSKNKWELYYGERRDKKSNTSLLKTTAIAQETGAVLDLVKQRNNQIQINSAYRKLAILDTSLITNNDDETFINKAIWKLNVLKGFINSNMFYQMGSGQELKREFYYLQVPIGSGTHTWVDYDGDNVQDINEFEIAQFTDQAEYIRVWRPSNEYVSTFTNEFNEGLQINPSRVIDTTKGVWGLVRRFSDQFSYQIKRKSTGDSYWSAANPFADNILDTNIISMNSSLRNTVFFNRSGAKFGGEYTYKKNTSKILLTNGLDGVSLQENNVQIRWNFTRKLGVRLIGEEGNKIRNSQFFESNNYHINQYKIQPNFFFQPNVKSRTSFNLYQEEKLNVLESERLKSKGGELEWRYSSSKAGMFSAKLLYANVEYNGDISTPLAFDMLEGLKVGENYIWSMNITKNLNKSLQLNLQYTGRKTGDNPIIHNGGMQVRALF